MTRTHKERSQFDIMLDFSEVKDKKSNIFVILTFYGKITKECTFLSFTSQKEAILHLVQLRKYILLNLVPEWS